MNDSTRPAKKSYEVYGRYLIFFALEIVGGRKLMKKNQQRDE